MYKSMAHWGTLGYVGPVTLEERLMHIEEAKLTLGTEIDWLADTMSNDLKRAIGDASNSEFVLDPDGRIVHMRLWSDPDVLRSDLEALVGPVDNPTRIADLDMEIEAPLDDIPAGVVPRVTLEGDFHPLRVEAQVDESEYPFYVKLRAAAETSVLTTGSGQLYLGFFLDPIYDVHWNNLVSPVEYEIFAPWGVSVSPTADQGPLVDVPADGDPREFVLEVDRGTSTEPLNLTFAYYGCTDVWCVLVNQRYLVSWDLDPDSGTQFGVGEIDPRMLDEFPARR